jgi:hypothetical protein
MSAICAAATACRRRWRFPLGVMRSSRPSIARAVARRRDRGISRGGGAGARRVIPWRSHAACRPGGRRRPAGAAVPRDARLAQRRSRRLAYPARPRPTTPAAIHAIDADRATVRHATTASISSPNHHPRRCAAAWLRQRDQPRGGQARSRCAEPRLLLCIDPVAGDTVFTSTSSPTRSIRVAIRNNSPRTLVILSRRLGRQRRPCPLVRNTAATGRCFIADVFHPVKFHPRVWAQFNPELGRATQRTAGAEPWRQLISVDQDRRRLATRRRTSSASGLNYVRRPRSIGSAAGALRSRMRPPSSPSPARISATTTVAISRYAG